MVLREIWCCGEYCVEGNMVLGGILFEGNMMLRGI